MTRQDLLTKLKILLDDSIGSSSDLMVSNTLKYAYLAEGQEKFCEETGFFIDMSSTVTQITTVSGTKDYTLDERIIKVLEVWDGTRKLYSIDEDVNYVNEFNLSTSGRPYLWRSDVEPGKIRLFPNPNSAITLQMRVWRYPLESLETSEPEIPSRFQWACIEWAAYKVLSIQDAEIRNGAKADEHLNKFMMYVNDGIKYLRRLKATNTKGGVNPLYNLGMV